MLWFSLKLGMISLKWTFSTIFWSWMKSSYPLSGIASAYHLILFRILWSFTTTITFKLCKISQAHSLVIRLFRSSQQLVILEVKNLLDLLQTFRYLEYPYLKKLSSDGHHAKLRSICKMAYYYIIILTLSGNWWFVFINYFIWQNKTSTTKCKFSTCCSGTKMGQFVQK